MMAIHAPFGLLPHLIVHLGARNLAFPPLGEELQTRDRIEALHDRVLLGRTQRTARGGEISEA